MAVDIFPMTIADPMALYGLFRHDFFLVNDAIYGFRFFGSYR